jgi:hypothetical protein
MKEVRCVDRTNGRDFYLTFDGLTLDDLSKDQTIFNEESTDRPRRFFVLLPNGTKVELRSAGCSTGPDGALFFVEAFDYDALRKVMMNLMVPRDVFSTKVSE